MSKPPRPMGKAARNERRKLRATTFNAIGLAFGAIGAIQPALVGLFTFQIVAKLVISAAIAYILHLRALSLLATLED